MNIKIHMMYFNGEHALLMALTAACQGFLCAIRKAGYFEKVSSFRAWADDAGSYALKWLFQRW